MRGNRLAFAHTDYGNTGNFGRTGSFASAINLSTLDGNTGFRLDGVATSDEAGINVSGAGDINGDGFDELIVGARGTDPNGSASGSSYVLFGSSGNFASARIRRVDTRRRRSPAVIGTARADQQKDDHPDSNKPGLKDVFIRTVILVV